MFNKVLKNNIIRLETKVSTLKNEKENLQDNIYELRRDISTMKSKFKVDEEQIKHMVKMAEEANEIKYQQKVLSNDKEKWTSIEKIKDSYRDKLEERLQKEVLDIKEMYGQVLERLPNINGKFTGKL